MKVKRFLVSAFVWAALVLFPLQVLAGSSLFTYPKFKAQTVTGAVISGGLLYTYAPGTTTPKATYSDSALSSANTNPVVLDSNGEAVIYFNGIYDVILKNAAGVTQWTMTGVSGSTSSYSGYEVDALNDYGNGTAFTQATIQSALTAIGTSTKKTLLLRSGTWTITSDANWSAYTNVVLKFAPGAVLQIATTKTLTWGGTVEAASQQIFSCVGTGLVVLPTGTTVYPEWWGATTSGDNSVALQAAFTAGAHGIVKLTKQFTSAAAIAIDHDTIVEGIGKDSSGITFSHTGDGLTSTSTIDTSTSVNITIRDLYLYNTSASNTGHGIVDVAGAYFNVERVQVRGFLHGLVLDQATHVHVTASHFWGQLAGGACIWIVNGADHTVTATHSYATNRIVIDGSNQFNAGAGTVYNIVDDGGVSHVITGNNFNVGSNAIRIAGVYGLIFSGNESEGHTNNSVLFSNTTLAGTSVTDSYAVSINGNTLDENVGNSINVDYVHGLDIRGNHFGQTGSACIVLANTTSNRATGVVLSGNTKTVTGDGKTAAVFLNGSAVPSYRVSVVGQQAQTYVAGTVTAGTVTVTPATMEFITVGAKLLARNSADNSNLETITVTATTATTFTAVFASDKAANWILEGSTSNLFYDLVKTHTAYKLASATSGGGLIQKFAEATANIEGDASTTITLSIPTGARLIGAQLRVDSALATGETWDAAYSGGCTTAIASGQAVAKNTKVNVLYNANAASAITTNTTNIAITKNGGGSFTAQGTIRAIVYYELNEVMADAP